MRRPLSFTFASAGSMRMWRWYFGEKAHITGIDIDPRTLRYKGDPRFGNPDNIIIADQSNASFWKSFKKSVQRIDILIDDGGHEPQHQTATLNGVFPLLSPVGVYWCEDVHKPRNEFANFVWRNFVDGEDGLNNVPNRMQANRRPLTYVQKHAAEVSFYPYLIVIEKQAHPLGDLHPVLRGRDLLSWQSTNSTFAAY